MRVDEIITNELLESESFAEPDLDFAGKNIACIHKLMSHKELYAKDWSEEELERWKKYFVILANSKSILFKDLSILIWESFVRGSQYNRDNYIKIHDDIADLVRKTLDTMGKITRSLDDDNNPPK